MKKDLIFFGEGGLTSTSANHMANMAKEYVANLQKDLENIDFVNISAALMGTKDSQVLQEGTTKEELNDVPTMLENIAKANAFIAWLREAIKARASLIKEVENFCLEEYCTMVGKEMPHYPEEPVEISEDSLIGELNIKERNRYYALEAKCAVLGKYIHPNGTFSQKRGELSNAIKHKHVLIGSGRDGIIKTYTPSVERQEVEDMFFKLQTIHRETQAELNSIKFKIEKQITDGNIKMQEDYKVRYNTYKNEILALENELKEWKFKEVQNISSLKIIIPNDHKEIYDIIQKVGK